MGRKRIKYSILGLLLIFFLPSVAVASYGDNIYGNVIYGDILSISGLTLTKDLDDTLNLTGVIGLKSMGKSITDTIALVDSSARVFTLKRTFPDNVSFLDARVKGMGRRSSDSTTLTDSFGKVSAFKKTSPDAISLIDLGKRNPVKKNADTITLADSFGKASEFKKTSADALSLADSSIRAAGFKLDRTDSMTFTDASTKAIGQKTSEVIIFTDADSKTARVLMPDTVILTDLFNRIALYMITFPDALTLIDEIFRVLNPGIHDWKQNLQDTMALADAISDKGLSKPIMDTMALADIFYKGTTKSVADSAVLTDAVRSRVGKNMADAVALIDSRGMQSIIGFSDAINLIDLFSSNMIVHNYQIGFGDSTNFADNYYKGIGQVLQDTIDMVDSLASTSAFKKTIPDTMQVTDSLAMQVILNIANSLSFSDTITPALNPGVVNWTLGLADAIRVSDIYAKSIGAILDDSMVLSAVISQGVMAKIADDLTLSDETLRTIEFYRTLANIIVMSDEISLKGLLEEIIHGFEVLPRIFQKDVNKGTFKPEVKERKFETIVRPPR